MPLKHNGATYGTAIFLFKTDTLQPILKSNLNSPNSFALLLDSSGQVLLKNDPQNLITTTKFNTKAQKIRLKQQPYYLEHYDSPDHFITLAIGNHSDSLVKLQSDYFKMFLVLLTLFTLSLIMIIYMSKRQSKPLQSIANLLKNQNDPTKNRLPYTTEELNQLSENVNQFMTQNKQLQIQLTSQSRQLKNKQLQDCLYGQINSDYLEALFPFSDFQIVLFENDAHDNKVLPIVRQLIKNDLKCHVELLELAFLKVNVLIFNGHSAAGIKDCLNDLDRRINYQASPQHRVHFYIGDVVSNLSDINRSFIEALAAKDTLFLNPDKTLIDYHQLSEKMQLDTDLLQFYPEIEAKLTNGLKQGNQAVALDSLQQYFDNIKAHQNHDKTQAFLTTCNLVLLIFKTGVESDVPDLKILLKRINLGADLDHLFDQLVITIEYICQINQQKLELNSQTLPDEILSFIQTHFCDHDLSLDLLAQKFEFSNAHLSRLIKEYSGQTFSSYLSQLRLAYIQDNLKTTTKPIKQIIEEAGYYDASNFTRKFKTLTGLTPSDYRKRNSLI